jgi:hypothetical protein
MSTEEGETERANAAFAMKNNRPTIGPRMKRDNSRPRKRGNGKSMAPSSLQ